MRILDSRDGDAGAVVGSVMAGYDGHRGWIDYLALHPAARAFYEAVGHQHTTGGQLREAAHL